MGFNDEDGNESEFALFPTRDQNFMTKMRIWKIGLILSILKKIHHANRRDSGFYGIQRHINSLERYRRLSPYPSSFAGGPM
jgi:hypothetical protein